MKVGVTGHQRLKDAAAWPWVEDVVRRELSTISGPVVVVSSLAVGADQLVARLGLEQGGALHAVLPFSNVERTFSAEELGAFRQLVNRAFVEVLQATAGDEEAYLMAGQRVVDLSDLVLAVWDGKPSKGRGGTADTVSYAVRLGVPIMHINPISRSITRLNRPSGGKNS